MGEIALETKRVVPMPTQTRFVWLDTMGHSRGVGGVLRPACSRSRTAGAPTCRYTRSRSVDADDVLHSRAICACSSGCESDGRVATRRQSGVIRISNLPAPQPGKDYQLWAVDAEHKDPISAGVVRVDKNGVAQIRFKPVEKAEHVKAFAISLEREGGVPKKEGPILLVGTT